MKLLNLLMINLTAILFLAGMILINVAMYIEFEVFVGLITTGISLIFIAIILAYEKGVE